MQNTPQKKKGQGASMKKKFVLVVVLFVLSIVLAVALPRLPLLNSLPITENSSAPSTVVVIQDRKAEMLKSIKISPLNEETFILHYINEKLYVEEGEALNEVQPIYAEALIKASTLILAEDTVALNLQEVESVLPDMGLDTPKSEVVIEYADGQSITLYLGGNVPHTNFGYFRWGNGVYLCNSDMFDVFTMTKRRLLPLEKIQISAKLINEVTLTLADKEPIKMTFESDNQGVVFGTMITPISYPLKSDETKKILTSLENFRLGTKVEVLVPEKMEKLGFDKPLAVIEIHQKEGAYSYSNQNGELLAKQLPVMDLRFVIGKQKGEHFYNCEYSGSYYLVNRYMLEYIMGIDPVQLLTNRPADVGDVELGKVSLQTGAGLIDIRVNYSEKVLPNNELELDEFGKPIIETTVVCNGENMSLEAWNALVKRMKEFSVAGKISDDFNIKEHSPRWIWTLKSLGGIERKIEGYTMDAFSDAIVVDGVMRHFADKDAMEIVFGDLLLK